MPSGASVVGTRYSVQEHPQGLIERLVPGSGAGTAAMSMRRRPGAGRKRGLREPRRGGSDRRGTHYGMAKAMTPPGRRGIADQTWLLMMLPGLFWAGNAVLGRAVAGEVPPVALAFWRWTVAAVLVLPFAWRHLRRDLRPLLRAWPVVLALSALGVGAFNTCLYIAAQTTSALNIVLLQSAMPVLVVAATFLLFREAPSARQASGVAVSLAGALVLVARGDPSVLARLAFNTGDLWMLAAVVSYAIYTAVHGLSFAAATFAAGAAMLLPLYAAETLGGRPLPLTATSVLAIGYVAA